MTLKCIFCALLGSMLAMLSLNAFAGDIYYHSLSTGMSDWRCKGYSTYSTLRGSAISELSDCTHNSSHQHLDIIYNATNVVRTAQ